jgi:hypothetical protein
MGLTIQPLTESLIGYLRDLGKRWSYQASFLDFTCDNEWRHELRLILKPRIHHDGKLHSIRTLLFETGRKGVFR